MKKLRPFWSADKLRELYAHEHNPDAWPEHGARIARTIEIAQDVINREDVRNIADYSCGSCRIIDGLKMWNAASYDISDVQRGDPSIEERVLTMPYTDLFLCTETIEHLESPWTVLEYIAMRTKWLVLSTPLDEDPNIGNYEHYWSFTQWDIATILDQSGFIDCKFEALGPMPGWTYTYQIWTARSRYNA